MFDIGFSELLLVLVIGLIVLGPERLPVAVKTVAGWIRAMRTLASSVQHELTQELKLQELQESLKKAEQVGLHNLTPELKASMDELKEVAESIQRSYHSDAQQPPVPHVPDDEEALYDAEERDTLAHPPPENAQTIQSTVETPVETGSLANTEADLNKVSHSSEVKEQGAVQQDGSK